MNNPIQEQSSLKPWESFDADLEANTVSATQEQNDAINDALELQMISIRLQKSLLTNLKLIASHHGIGYQPLIRDLLNRFVKSEIRSILIDIEARRKEFEALEKGSKDIEPMEQIDNFLEREAIRKQA